ncbi:MAG: hypothetical protein J0H06_13545, partial [Actinobacteria bacterium]|nr:hypothetical protein [Actinomycetota bacterium]
MTVIENPSAAICEQKAAALAAVFCNPVRIGEREERGRRRRFGYRRFARGSISRPLTRERAHAFRPLRAVA